tara:strand:+ start:3087 stop:3317 length:231 start_codon:yes stop_codon:yes gene_type:complete
MQLEGTGKNFDNKDKDDNHLGENADDPKKSMAHNSVILVLVQHNVQQPRQYRCESIANNVLVIDELKMRTKKYPDI